MRWNTLGVWSIYLGTVPKYRLRVGKHWGCTWCIQWDAPWLGIPCQIQMISGSHGQDIQHFLIYTKPQAPPPLSLALLADWHGDPCLLEHERSRDVPENDSVRAYGIFVMTDTSWKETTFLSLRGENPWLSIVLQGKGFSLFPRLPKARRTYYLFASNSLQINRVTRFYPLCKFKQLLCER